MMWPSFQCVPWGPPRALSIHLTQTLCHRLGFDKKPSICTHLGILFHEVQRWRRNRETKSLSSVTRGRLERDPLARSPPTTSRSPTPHIALHHERGVVNPLKWRFMLVTYRIALCITIVLVHMRCTTWLQNYRCNSYGRSLIIRWWTKLLCWDVLQIHVLISLYLHVDMIALWLVDASCKRFMGTSKHYQKHPIPVGLIGMA
jgi:hypothetical protein